METIPKLKSLDIPPGKVPTPASGIEIKKTICDICNPNHAFKRLGFPAALAIGYGMSFSSLSFFATAAVIDSITSVRDSGLRVADWPDQTRPSPATE